MGKDSNCKRWTAMFQPLMISIFLSIIDINNLAVFCSPSLFQSSRSPWEWNVAITFQSIKEDVNEPHANEKGCGQELDEKRATLQIRKIKFPLCSQLAHGALRIAWTHLKIFLVAKSKSIRGFVRPSVLLRINQPTVSDF